MRIRPRNQTRGGAGRVRGKRRSATLRFGLAILYTTAIIAVVVAALESVRPTLAHSGLESPREVANALLGAPWNYMRALARPVATPELQIDVQFKHMHKIHEQRADALRRGVLFASDDDLAPGTVTFGGSRCFDVLQFVEIRRAVRHFVIDEPVTRSCRRRPQARN